MADRTPAHETLTGLQLDKLMRAVLLEISIVSVTPAAGQERTSAGKPGSKLLIGVDAPHLHLARQYRRATTLKDKRDLITAALECLRELRYSRRPPVDCQTRDGRLTVGRDPRPARIVAYVYGYSLRHIYRLRAEAKEHDRREARKAASLPLRTIPFAREDLAREVRHDDRRAA